jgi:hypothetical protein
MALLILNLGDRRGWVVSTTPRPLYSREKPGTHCTRGWVGPRAGLDVCETSHPTGIMSPDSPASSESLYRLSYLAHWTTGWTCSKWRSKAYVKTKTLATHNCVHFFPHTIILFADCDLLGYDTVQDAGWFLSFRRMLLNSLCHASASLHLFSRIKNLKFVLIILKIRLKTNGIAASKW